MRDKDITVLQERVERLLNMDDVYGYELYHLIEKLCDRIEELENE